MANDEKSGGLLKWTIIPVLLARHRGRRMVLQEQARPQT